MKLFARPKYFFEATALVTTISHISGLRVFEYPRGHPRPILSLTYLLFLYIVFCNGWLRVHGKYYANVRLMKLEYVLYQLLKYVVIVSVIMKMLLGWWHTKKFKICHKKISEIDATLRQLGLTVNYDKIYFATIGTMTVWITFIFTMCTVVFFHLQISTDVFTSIYLILVGTYSYTVNSINVFEFCMFARCLRTKFGLVNQFLHEILTDLSTKKMKLDTLEVRDYAKIIDVEQRKQVLSRKMIFQLHQRIQSRINVPISEKQDSIVPQSESQFPSHVTKQFQNVLESRFRRHNSTMTNRQKRKCLLQVIKQVHLELCKVSKIICTIYGVQIAWEIGVTTMGLTASLYNLYVRYIINGYKVAGLVGETFVTLMLCSLHIVRAVLLSRVCKNAADEGNRTMEIIHTFYGCNSDSDMQEEIQQFGIQILQYPMRFLTFGLTLDNRILSMILKTVAIYLVIMVQMSNTLESNEAIKHSRL